jgi:superfamily I DNA/RNA helicase
MRGRSTVMKESFRSTRPITEFALNVLYSLSDPKADPDHRELIDRGLIEETNRRGRSWWQVRFNQIHGPLPVVKPFQSYQQGFEALGRRVLDLVRNEGVAPRDISIIVHRKWAAEKLLEANHAIWQAAGIRGEYNVSKPGQRDANAVVVCTANSFKGYEAEVIFIAGIEQFILGENIQSHHLYVAMTRARSVLHIYGWQRSGPGERRLFDVLNQCSDCLTRDHSRVESPSQLDEVQELVDRLGEDNRDWLDSLIRHHKINQDLLLGTDGEILAQPLFWLEYAGIRWANFGSEEVGPALRNRLEDLGIKILGPGQAVT